MLDKFLRPSSLSELALLKLCLMLSTVFANRKPVVD